MSKKGLIWKIPLAVAGIAAGVVLLLIVAITCVVSVPSLRKAATEKGLAFAREQTGMDIDVGKIEILHLSPSSLYRAWRGKADLPVELNIDSVYVGHRGEDTLIYVHTLRLNAKLLTSDNQPLTSAPIEVEHLLLDRTTFHSDSMIASVGVDVIVGHLETSSPGISISRGEYPLHGLRLADTYVGIDLRDNPDTTAHDTTPLQMAFIVPDGELRNIHFALTPIGLDIATRTIQTNVVADVGGHWYFSNLRAKIQRSTQNAK